MLLNLFLFVFSCQYEVQLYLGLDCFQLLQCLPFWSSQYLLVEEPGFLPQHGYDFDLFSYQETPASDFSGSSALWESENMVKPPFSSLVSQILVIAVLTEHTSTRSLPYYVLFWNSCQAQIVDVFDSSAWRCSTGCLIRRAKNTMWILTSVQIHFLIHINMHISKEDILRLG